MNQVVISKGAEPAEVAEFYRRAGYSGGVGESDLVLAARINGALVGVTRLAQENQILVLRGMQVVQKFQRKGVGTKLLGSAVEAIGDLECWCIPYDYLCGFYAGADFEETSDAESPEFLVERLLRYNESGKSVVLMKRKAAGTCGGEPA